MKKSSSATPQVVRGEYTPKNEVEKAEIMSAVNNNRLFRFLDEKQKEGLVDACSLVAFNEGDLISQQGDVGDAFYIVHSGTAEVFFDSSQKKGSDVLIQKRSKGTAFGHQSLLFDFDRSVTVKASSPVVAWALDKKTFQTKVLQTEDISATFEKHATPGVNGGEPSLSAEKFIQSISDPMVQASTPISAARVDAIFNIIGGRKEGISRKEYAVLRTIMLKPDCEYDLVFMLFNSNRKGSISLDDVVRVLESRNRFKFDRKSSLVRRFFGEDGKRTLRMSEFAEFFIQLQKEIPRQLFQAKDSKQSGYITVEDFLSIVKDFSYWRLSEGITNRLIETRKVRVDSEDRVSYAEFIAFGNLLGDLHAIQNVLIRAGGLFRDVDKVKFKIAASKLYADISPIECDIIYHIFDIKGIGKISMEDFHTVTANKMRKDKRRQDRPADGRSGFVNGLIEAAINFGMGAIAGAIGATAVYPIDLVKTRMQNQRDNAARLYNNSFDCFAKVLKGEGPLALYRGLGPQLLGVAPEKAIKLTVNDLLRSLFEDKHSRKIYFPLEILAGMGAGASQVVFTNPLEIVKIRLQIQGEAVKLGAQPKGAMTIVRELGLSGLYKGAGACLLRDIPFSGIYFPAYAAAKYLLTKEKGTLGPTDLLLAGAAAGIPAASITTPADVIKTRLQVEARKGQATYSGIRDCAYKVYQQEGFKAFWKGSGARVFRSSPQFGITLLAYESLHRLIPADVAPRPPTNAPVSAHDFGAMRGEVVAYKLREIDRMFDALSGTA